ncbi:uncharacterized protein [Cicer arietinum]|uniref:Dof zinc finger protein n=1 Tax=Cicer arietinum TaxID=3827 RepID=A0A1S2YC21_CICAR|nr:dof zinc finger protein DOF5.1 [Cicer arietinum]
MFPQRHNNISSIELEQMLHLLSSSSSSPIPLSTSMDKSNSRWKPNIEIAPNCPRCASTNTKFCYYNNYSLSQPRYFCKGCRRYWTKGGSLRNVPVGGGCRKTRRGKTIRNSHTDRLSANGSEDDADGHHHQSQNNGSRDIDMALVFAKFLNQNPTNSDHGEEFENENEPINNGSPSSNNINNLSTPESVETENDAVVHPQNPFDADSVALNGELSLSGIDEFEGFLGVDEDVVQDVLWSHSDANANVNAMMMVSSSNYTWQQPSSMMQMDELEYSMPLPILNENGTHDDQLLSHTFNSNSTTVNLINDSWNSWGSFDLSTMEVFSSSSRP